MIDFDKYYSLAVYYVTYNIFVTIGLCLILVIFFYKKPEGTTKFLGFCALFIAVFYVMSLLSSSGTQGVTSKKGLTTKSEKELMDSTR